LCSSSTCPTPLKNPPHGTATSGSFASR
jgi:hypothetical protein